MFPTVERNCIQNLRSIQLIEIYKLRRNNRWSSKGKWEFWWLIRVLRKYLSSEIFSPFSRQTFLLFIKLRSSKKKKIKSSFAPFFHTPLMQSTKQVSKQMLTVFRFVDKISAAESIFKLTFQNSLKIEFSSAEVEIFFPWIFGNALLKYPNSIEMGEYPA